MSTLSTASDESLLLWFLCIHGEKWASKKNNEGDVDDDDEEESPPKKKKPKKDGKHTS